MNIIKGETPRTHLGAVSKSLRRSPAQYQRIAKLLKEDTQDLNDYFERIVGPEPRPLAHYRKVYMNELGSFLPAEILNREACLAEAVKADLIYCGDVHSSLGPQAVCLNLLNAIKYSQKSAVLVIEFLKTCDQDVLDGFNRKELGVDELMTYVKTMGRWNFPTSGYKSILAAAQRDGVIVLAGNSDGELKLRDQNAAVVIANAAVRYPNAKILVQFGQLHLGSQHLPQEVSRLLSKQGLERRTSRVLTGDHESYFNLAARGQYPQAARLDESSFCIYATRPRGALRSYLRLIGMV